MNNILNTASFALPLARMTCFGAATYFVGKNAAQAAAGYGLQAGSKMATCLDKADLAKSMQLTGESYANTVKNNVVKDVTKAVAFVAAGFAAEYADGLVDAKFVADQSILDVQLAADQSILENVMDQASEVVEEVVELGKSVVSDSTAAFDSAKTFVGSFIPDNSSFIPDTSSFIPDTSSFIPDTSSFIPDTSSFIPKKSYDVLKEKAILNATAELAFSRYEKYPAETVTLGVIITELVGFGALYAATKLVGPGLLKVGKAVVYNPVTVRCKAMASKAAAAAVVAAHSPLVAFGLNQGFQQLAQQALISLQQTLIPQQQAAVSAAVVANAVMQGRLQRKAIMFNTLE